MFAGLAPCGYIRDMTAPSSRPIGPAGSVPPSIRLSPRDSNALRAAFEETLPSDARVYLFGSRADSAKRGGDIDLLVHVPGISPEQAYELRKRIALALMRHAEEQRIDVLVTPDLDDRASTFVQLSVMDAVSIWP